MFLLHSEKNQGEFTEAGIRKLKAEQNVCFGLVVILSMSQLYVHLLKCIKFKSTIYIYF